MREFLKSLPGKIKHNLWLKLLSLVLAFVVWVIVVAYYNPESTNVIEDIPITVDYQQAMLQEQGLILVTIPEATVDVKIEGRREKLALVSKDKVTAVVSVASVTKPGEYDLPVNVAIDGQAVTTVSQTVQTMHLKFEKAVTAQFTVDVITKGEVAEGYTLDKVANPTIATVTGPESVVEKISTLQAVVSKEQFSESGSYDATVLYLDKNGEKLDDSLLTCDAVKVNISVLEEKQVPLQVVLNNETGGNDSAYLKVSVEPATITVAGSTETLASLNSIPLEAIDISEITTETVKEIPLILPNGIKPVNAVENAKVSISFEGTVTKQFKFSTSEIGISNTVGNSDIELPKGEITITVRGNAEDMGKLKASDIALRIDCKNQKLAKGSQNMLVYCSFPETYKVGAVGKYKLTVKVS
ncbi:MAG: hypothetical protein IJN42_00140 [Clostridia bacterium]|nr:hypothetical protein [Clostridia bacterium]